MVSMGDGVARIIHPTQMMLRELTDKIILHMWVSVTFYLVNVQPSLSFAIISTSIFS